MRTKDEMERMRTCLDICTLRLHGCNCISVCICICVCIMCVWAGCMYMYECVGGPYASTYIHTCMKLTDVSEISIV